MAEAGSPQESPGNSDQATLTGTLFDGTGIVGDTVRVKVLEVDMQGRIRLSMRDVNDP